MWRHTDRDYGVPTSVRKKTRSSVATIMVMSPVWTVTTRREPHRQLEKDLRKIFVRTSDDTIDNHVRAGESSLVFTEVENKNRDTRRGMSIAEPIVTMRRTTRADEMAA